MKFSYLKLSFFALLFITLSCKKMGCRDVQAINYHAGAKQDDGSCVYTSQLTIWFNSNQSATLQSNNVSELRFYLSGVFLGSVPSSDFLLNAPNCGDTVAFTREISLGKVAKKDYTLIVRDQSENFLLTKSMTLEGQGCYLYPLN